jgi:peroxiredoxin
VKGPLGLGVRRVSYLIAPDGTVRERLRADFQVARHEAFLRRALKT